MIKFKLTQYNYQALPYLAEFLRQNKEKEVEIEPTHQLDDLPRFSEITPFLYSILDYEQFFGVWLKNIPFCVLSPEAVDHIIREDNFQGKKTKDCQNCFWDNFCPGFPPGYLDKYGKNEVCPRPDLPWEVMIEVEPKCNFNCQFCFNKISFAKDGRNIKEFDASYLKKVIDGIAKAGIKIVRFTGGEPMLRKDIFELIKYAKNKGLETRLNTNGSLINQKTVEKLKGILDNVLIPIESYADKKEAEITGCANSLKKKIEAIKLLKKENIPIVRAGTVATGENILNFDKISDFLFQLPIDEWELYRPIPVSGKEELNSKLINLLVEKIIELRKKTQKAVFIANALPFCAVNNLNKINSVSKGGLFDDGHTRVVIDPRRFVKPHYFIEENIGDPLDIIGAWQHPFLKGIRNLKFLPKECHHCRFVYKCRGGSRFAAKLVFGQYQKRDPLARQVNFKKT